VQYFTRFQLTARSRGPSAIAGLLVYLSTRPSTLTSTRVLVNTGSTLIRAASDEEGGSGLVALAFSPAAGCIISPLHVYIHIYFQAGML